MAESIFNGSKVSFYVITKSEYDKIENKSLENVKNLPHNAVIFCNDETCYKMYVTDNNWTSVKFFIHYILFNTANRQTPAFLQASGDCLSGVTYIDTSMT